MRLSIRVFLTIIPLIFLAKNLFSQQTPDKYKIGHLAYLIHVVEKNETLRKIAATYQVTVKEIMDVNTIADPEKIREGESIVVPDYRDFIDAYPRDKWNYELYKVVKGDKLKSLAKKHKITVDDIVNVNWRLDKPVVGAVIRIPVPKTGDSNESIQKTEPSQKNDKEKDNRDKDSKEKENNPALNFNWGGGNQKDKDKKNEAKNDGISAAVDTEYRDCSTFVFKQGMTFTVALVVPLTGENGVANPSGMAFLQGSLIAVNALKDAGLSVNLNVFDAGKQGKIDKLIQSDEFRRSNIIIAPLLPNLSKLAQFAKDNKISLVVPSSSEAGNIQTLIESNPYLIYIPANAAALDRKIVETAPADNVVPILIVPPHPDSAMLETYRARLKKRYGKFTEHVHLMTWKPENLPFKTLLSEDKHNRIYVCADSEAYVSNLLVGLNIVKGYPLSVYGREVWGRFHLISRPRYFDVNLHIPQSQYIDYRDENTKQFVRLYRGAYNTDPDTHAFMGYDVSHYFLTALQKYGHTFQDCFNEFHSTMLQSQFKFYRNQPGSGFVNAGCFVLEYTTDIETRRE
ncbi:MAG: LysM peptidoglycan-binding domain-containing protein [Prevotellaceae bacterium]|jgi:LysM repeat protein|nr:LysM peptidoglycan-binding domain-containing protein [Prevotellaceae bacterium]